MIRASANSKHSQVVTVLDVLESVHRCLRINVTTAEFAMVKNPDDQRKIEDGYRTRYRMMTDESARAYEKSLGVLRVDFLIGKSHFAGLSRSTSNPEQWSLHVS